MAEGPHEDVASTLSALERRLIELERELIAVAGATPARHAASEADLAVPPVPGRAPAAESLRDEIEALVATRDRLRELADELVERCDRLVGRLQLAETAGEQPRRDTSAD